MKKYLKRVAAALLLLAVCTSLIPLKADAQITENDTLKLLTDSYQSGRGSFTLADTARMLVIADTAPTDELLQTAELINSEFAAAGLPTAQPLPLFWGSSNCALPGDVILELTEGLAADGYRLTITKEHLTVSASDVDGLLNGAFMAIRHFMVYGGNEIPACTVQDEPDTRERTVMLDCARKYWTVDWIKNLIRQMSWMGYNTLELHMTEDQGIHANIWRDANGNVVTDCNGNDFGWLPGYKEAKWASDANNGQISGVSVQDPNGRSNYNRDELIEILNCAKEYHIEVIPGVDVPGHCDYLIYQWDHSGASGSFTFNYKGTNYSNRPSAIYISDSWLYPNDTYKSYGTLDVTNDYTKKMSLALIEAYATFFQEYGNSTKMNIGCDEIRGSLSYDSFVSYVNEVCAMLKSHNYRVRAFNDYLYDSSNVPLDRDLEICYWQTSDNASVANYIADNRTVYNCINVFTYYVLRYNKTQGDARSETCLQWAFHHSTEERIFSGCGGNCKKNNYNPCYSSTGWNPSKLCSVQDATQYTYSGEKLGGGYFLIWGDWAGWSTEVQVWNGIDSNGTYNLIDRMWSNSIKMWNWDVDSASSSNGLSYSDYKSLRNRYRLYPGFTAPSAAPSIPTASTMQQATDFTALREQIGQTPKLPEEEYTPESYAAYQTALAAAQSICGDPTATQSQVDEALETLRRAFSGLKAQAAHVIFKAMVGSTEKVIEEIEVDGGEVAMELRSRRGYRFLRVEGDATFQPLRSGAEGGVLRGTVSKAMPIVVWYENAPQTDILARMLAADDSALVAADANYAAQKQQAKDFFDSVKGEPGAKTTQSEIDSYVSSLIVARSNAVLAADQTRIINLKTTTDYVVEGKSAVLLVTTSADVRSVSVEGVTLEECQGKLSVTDGGEQVKIWYLSFVMTQASDTPYTYTVTASGATTVTATIDILCR